MPDALDLVHVLRPSLPWRPETLTECGRAPDRLDVIDRDELQARWKAWGEMRTSMTTCMTCLSTARRWPTWEQSPAGCLGRFVNRPHGAEGGHDLLNRELRAIELMIAAHRDEFDETVDALAAAVPLQLRRSRRA